MQRVVSTVVASALVILGCLVAANLAAAQGVIVAGSPSGGAPTGVDEAGTAAVSGVVSDGLEGRPVPGVVVSLSRSARSAGQAVRRMTTDGAGRFVFVDLPAGEYYVHAARPGYFDGGFGLETPGEGERKAVVLADGQWFDRAQVPLWRPGAITGTVTDEAGEPLVGAIVRVLALVTLAGVEQVAAGPFVRTDDRGRYRIAGLAPGRYVVSVPSVQQAVPAGTSAYELIGQTPERYATALRAGRAPAIPGAVASDDGSLLVAGEFPVLPLAGLRPQAYPQTFYPDARTIDAAVGVEPTYGQDIGGIDIQLRSVPAARVSGRVVGPPDAVAGMVLRLLSPGLEGLAHGSEAATALVGADGSFSFLRVPAGAYTLLASRSVTQYHYTPVGDNRDATLPEPPGFGRSGMSAGDIPSGPPGVGYASARLSGDDTFWGRADISVGAGDLDGIVVELQPSVSIRGRVEWESGEPDPPMTTRVGPGGATTQRATTLPVYADPADGNAVLGMLRGSYVIESGEFSVEGLRLGEYRLRFLGAPAVKSILWNGVDYTDRPFDAGAAADLDGVVVTVTDATATITGTVTRDGGTLDRATVLAFPTDRERWSKFGFSPPRLQSATLDSNGAYSVSLPAGEYFVVAVTDVPPGGWQRPDLLRQLAVGAQTVSLDWGVTRSLVLTAREIR